MSVARPVRWWYVACRSTALRRHPLARTLLGMPLVFFRDASGRPAALVRWLLVPLAMRILRQDAAVLRRQTENIRRFGGEQYESELDLLGPHVWRLLREAEEGVAVPGRPPTLEREVRFLA